MLALCAALLLAETPPGLYTIKAQVASADAHGEVKVGQPATLEVKFDVAKDAHISDEAPLTIKLKGEGVTFPKEVLHYADSQKVAGSAGLSFKPQVTASTPGAHTVDVDLSFYVCTAELCNKATEHKTLTLSAK